MTAALDSPAPEPFAVTLPDGQAVTALHYAGVPASGAAVGPPGRPDATLVIAHGAGAGQHSAFITTFARAIAAHGIDAVTFDFVYMERRRRLPDRAPALVACYAAVVEATRRRIASAGRALFIGGKSMGGRMATELAASDPGLPLQGLVLLGYPLHPQGRPQQRRDAHLPRIRRPMLFVQGSRDAFGTPADLEPVLARLPTPATLHAVEGGDHSFALPRSARERQPLVDDDIRSTVAGWIRAHTGGAAAFHG